MPSKKQRRRRQKSRRHEYEYVYVDDDGHEVEVDPEDLPRPAPARDGASRRAPATRGGRTIQPPSWTRVAKRGLLFAPLMFLTVTLLSKDLSLGRRVSQTLFLLAFFLPFSYVMDSLLYRSYLRRTGAAPPETQRRRWRG